MKRKNDQGKIVFFILILVIFFILYTPILSFASAQDNLASGGLWINKTTNQSSYSKEENITYVIEYGNNAKEQTFAEVCVTDILPDVEVINAYPLPDLANENNLTWNIGTLGPGENGSIILEVKPDITKLDFFEDSSVSGKGYVNTRKKISTLKSNAPLSNTAIIKGVFQGKATGIISSTVAVIINLVSINVKSSEHGSGYYKEDQRSSLNNSKSTVKLNKELSARHESVSLNLTGARSIELSSLWSDRTSAWTNSSGITTSVEDEYLYMDSIEKEISYNIAGSEIIYSSVGDFSGGIAHIGYNRKEPREPGRKGNVAYISETYHGSFKVSQHLDSYGTSPTYRKGASGIGFVSSQKVLNCDKRSGEQGSGIYNSAESIQADTVEKNIDLSYMPNEQKAGKSNITYANKWGEFMYTRDPDKGTEIMNRISSADYVQKEALMSKTYLSMTGSFAGTDYLKAKALSRSNNSTGESFHLEQQLVGSYRLDTTIGLSESVKYSYPHINLTKRVLSHSGSVFTYRILVNNDGNKTLEPVAIVDLLPEGATFISSTLKPSLKGRLVSWSLQALPPGETQIIDIKVTLPSISSSVINRVQAAARYQNRTIIAEAATSPFDTIATGNATTNESIAKEEALSTGDWRTPVCFDINSSVIGCEYYRNEYYDSIAGECEDIP